MFFLAEICYSASMFQNIWWLQKRKCTGTISETKEAEAKASTAFDKCAVSFQGQIDGTLLRCARYKAGSESDLKGKQKVAKGFVLFPDCKGFIS